MKSVQLSYNSILLLRRVFTSENSNWTGFTNQLPLSSFKPLETDMAAVHLLLGFFITLLNEDLNQHHYCRFPLLAELTKLCKGQDAGMKGNA